MRPIFISFVLSLLMFSCAKTTNPTPAPDGAVFTENLIQTYIEPLTVKFSSTENAILCVTIDGGSYSNFYSATKARHSDFARINNDLSFNSKLVPNTTSAVSDKISSIDITCSEDIDENHPAGTSIADLVKIATVSFKEFIANNYKNLPSTPSFPAELKNQPLYRGVGGYPIFSKLNELKAGDLSLVTPDIYILLPKNIPSRNYEFTVTVNFKNAKILTGSFIVSID